MASPGIYTDQASTILDSLGPELPADVRSFLSRLSGESVDRGEVRRNPDKSHGGRPREHIILPRHELLMSAMLITGAWGVDAPNADRVLDGQFRVAGRRRLPVVRENPRGPARLADDFWTRMDKLATELDRVRKLVLRNVKRYKLAPSKWIRVLDKCARAVAFARAARDVPASERSVFDAHGAPLGLPLNTTDGWEPLAEGNSKLPFYAYSELPMATCQGAGECGVALDAYDPRPAGTKKPRTGWCYSFRAFAYPDAFARMFLSTLANALDREVAIEAGRPDGNDYAARARAAMRGADRRLWPTYVLWLAQGLTRATRADGRPAFLRLFVDGDINHEDSILAWMDAIARTGPGGRDVESGRGPLEVYGYSKCWQAFCNAGHWLAAHGGVWPRNYALNLSSGSVYDSAAYAGVRAEVEQLPITRGYFRAVKVVATRDVKRYLGDLVAQARALKTALASDPDAAVPMQKMGFDGLAFDAARVRAFALLADATTPVEVEQAFAQLGALGRLPLIVWPSTPGGKLRKLNPDAVRRRAYAHYLRWLLAEPEFGAKVRRELVRDAAELTLDAELDRYEESQRARLRDALASGRTPQDRKFSRRELEKKALALAIHETLWALDQGGSCPLVCGNCSDDPGNPRAVHRCASKTTFRARTIHIVIH